MLWRAVALLVAAIPLGTRAATAMRAAIVGQVDSPATSHRPNPVASLHPRARPARRAICRANAAQMPRQLPTSCLAH